MLHSEPLFQVDVMKAELVVTHSRAKLLPAKFTDRVPQLPPEFRPKSHSLPPTDGITILERLIQLGESCHWFTQKLEHVWGFHRALDESFSLTLLQVEHLFDIDNLVGLFQKSDRNKGAGFCSRSLMDRVESMVWEMVEKGDRGDGSEEKMLFCPLELFGSQHQPKFCSSVEVTLRPYVGRQPHIRLFH